MTISESAATHWKRRVVQEPPGDGPHESPTEPSARDWLIAIAGLIHERDRLQERLVQRNRDYLELHRDFMQLEEDYRELREWHKAATR